MKVLIACEESQEVCKAFRARGHEAYSCDILPCSGGHPEWHLEGDVRRFLFEQWDLIIAHPPCTRLANSGVQWLAKRNLWSELYDACQFFGLFQLIVKLRPLTKVCIENPIPHKYAKEVVGPYTQVIQKLQPTDIVEGREQRIWRMPPGVDRAKLRSKTFPGIAKAMADQWG